MGRTPISPTELAAWKKGTMAELGPIDFQDVLDLSSIFLSALAEFGDKYCDPPWSPELTPDEQAQYELAQEEKWDKIMGVGIDVN